MSTENFYIYITNLILSFLLDVNLTKEYPEYVGHFLLEFLIKR